MFLQDIGEQSWRWDGAKKARTGPAKPTVPIVSERSIYVKNLPYGGTEEDIEAFFSRAGTVVRAPPSKAIGYSPQSDLRL
jgi:RNA recognition motif-containing protein